MSPTTASNKRRRAYRPLAREHGVGLIEILVAVLILSIGLLGIALVQTRALSNNNSSMSRSMATIASYTILDAMRADRANLASYDDITVTGDDCPDAGGSLASAQISDWCRQLAATLGEADTTIGTIDCNGNECTVTVQFDDSRVGVSGASDQKVETKAAL